MTADWEALYEEMLDEIKRGKINQLSPKVFAFRQLWHNVRDLVNNAMGSDSDDFEKVLRQAEEMMKQYDPEKTFYRKRLLGKHPENGAARFRKENPDRYDVIVN
ncbi:MAG: hypothetical protein LWY06_12525 [Firmicutes bacterium]|nr:hypothetical protein [Bacillota bacterium]